MTEDYKKNLLNYMTNKIVEGTPTTDEIIKQQTEENRSKWTPYIPNGWANFHFENIIKDKNSNKYILYGGYRSSESTSVDDNVYGIIILLDENLNPYKSFYEFDNGTKLRSILLMNQAEDGTFYMIDDTSYTNFNSRSVNNNPRFVILNNFILEDKIKLRVSYNLPYRTNADISYFFGFKSIEKNPNQAQYVIITEYQKFNAHGSSGGGLLTWYAGVCCIELNIPYGASPEWKWIEIAKGKSTQEESYSSGYYRASFIKFSENKYLVKAVCLEDNNNYSAYSYYFKDYTSSSFTKTIIQTLTTSEYLLVQGYYRLEQQDIFINETDCYFVDGNLEHDTIRAGTIKLYHYNTSNNTLTTIYENNYPAPETAGYNRKEAIFLAQNQGKLYIQYLLCTGETWEDYQYNYYFQRYEGTWNPILIGENQLCQTPFRAFYINNNYNLLKVFIYPNNPRRATWYFKILKEVYNPVQYNGEPYVSKDSLSPLYVNLYSNGSLIFSRNLYNISKQNNMTMSSVEIPNTYLNDINITENDLISETNLEMNKDPKQWTKNIYEVVDLNFLNTITIIDEDTNTPYINGAIKLNQATTDGGATNYTNAPCTKYRINYADNTTDIQEMNWLDIDSYNKQVQISIYVDKAMLSIDLLSHDENTIYLTIPLEVEIGKYYTIKQKVRIGDKPTPVQLQYNNEDILYNNQPVMVYTREV